MMQVQISTHPTLLEISTQPAALNLRSQPARMNIDTEAAKAEIRQAQGTLSIDSYPCRAAIGFKNAADLSHDIAQKGRRAAQETVAEYVRDGNRLARINSPANSVAQLMADRNAAEMQPLSITWAYVPLPEIDYQPTPTRISWTPAQTRIQAQPMKVQGDFVPGRVDTRVAQYASIRVQAIETGNAINVQT